MSLLGQNNFKLPKQWDKTFVISVAHTGSMSGGSSRVTFTYDSCTYEISPLREKSENKSFPLSQKDRDIILAKLRKLNIDKVKPKLHLGGQHDGWSTLLCLGGHCIEGGSAAQMSGKDKGIFVDACSYLEDFATNK